MMEQARGRSRSELYLARDSSRFRAASGLTFALSSAIHFRTNASLPVGGCYLRTE